MIEPPAAAFPAASEATDAVDVAAPETGLVPAPALRLVVGDQRRDRAPGSGQDPDRCPDHGRPEHVHRPAHDTQDRLERRSLAFYIVGDVGVFVPVTNHLDDLWNGEDADKGGDDRDSAEQLGNTEGVPGHRAGRADPHRTYEHADPATGDPLEQRVTGDAPDHGDREDPDPEELRRSEGQCDVCQGAGEEQEGESPDDGADQRAETGCDQRGLAPSLLRHREAVQRRRHCQGCTGGIHQVSGHRVREHRRDIQGSQHREALSRLQREGERQHQRRAHGRGEPG